MIQPPCFNRLPYADTAIVQDGWIYQRVKGEFVRLPKLKEIPDPMSKDCKQWEDFGLAKTENWNCTGCRWFKETFDK